MCVCVCCVVFQFESAFFSLSATSDPSPAPDIFGIIPEFGQSRVSASLIVRKPEYLSFVDPARRVYTVTVSDCCSARLAGSVADWL